MVLGRAGVEGSPTHAPRAHAHSPAPRARGVPLPCGAAAGVGAPYSSRPAAICRCTRCAAQRSTWALSDRGRRVPRSLWCGDVGSARPMKASLSRASSAQDTSPLPGCQAKAPAHLTRLWAKAGSAPVHPGGTLGRMRSAGTGGSRGSRPQQGGGGGHLLGSGMRPPPPALRAHLIAKGQQLLAIHMVAPKVPKIFFSFPLPNLSTLHPNIILEPNLDSTAHPNPQPTPNPTPKTFPLTLTLIKTGYWDRAGGGGNISYDW